MADEDDRASGIEEPDYDLVPEGGKDVRLSVIVRKRAAREGIEELRKYRYVRQPGDTDEDEAAGNEICRILLGIAEFEKGGKTGS